MERLVFVNANFNDALNYTVRLGDKWLKRIKVGQHVWLEQIDKGVVGEAVITEVIYTGFRDIPKRVQDFEHDERCRTLDGLGSVLCNVYPEVSKNHHVEWFTAIGFVALPVKPEDAAKGA